MNETEPTAAPEIEPARYLDGVPANVQAAALDALRWLEEFRADPDLCMRDLSDAYNRPAFIRMIDALNEQVKPWKEEARQIHTKSRAFPEAVAVIVPLDSPKV